MLPQAAAVDRTKPSSEEDPIGRGPVGARAGGVGVGGLGLCAERAELRRLRLPLRLRLRELLGLLALIVLIHGVGAVQRVAPPDVAVAAVEPGHGKVMVTVRRGPGSGFEIRLGLGLGFGSGSGLG